MKSLLLMTLVALVAAGNALAGGGSIGIFTSNTAVSCAVVQGASTTTVAVVHKGHTGATASGFSNPLPPCANGLIWVADQPVVPVFLPNDTLGSQGGVSAGYGTCRSDAVHVTSILLQRISLLAGCCLWTVKPNLLLAPTVISTDCSPNPVEEIANGTSAYVRPTGTTVATCPCNVPNEASTWGVIKELFRQGS